MDLSPPGRRREETVDASPSQGDGFSPQQRYALELQRQILEQTNRRDRERRAVRDENPFRDDRQEGRPEDRVRRQRQQQAELLNAQVEENKRRREEAVKRQAEEERREDERIQREQQQMRDRYLSEKGLTGARREPQGPENPEPLTVRRSEVRRKASEERRKAEREPEEMEQTAPLDSKLLLHLADQVDRLVQDSQYLQEQLALVQRQANANPAETVRSSSEMQTISLHPATTASTQTTAESWVQSSARRTQASKKHVDSVDVLAGSSWAPQPLPSHPVAAQRRGIAKPRHRSAMLDELEQRSHDNSYAVF